ncbi:ribulose-phosphate 3-epimerase [Neobacillus drentensis]|uniref:ribulose-phosphate 3-epimerase n=1 Tax=Neobacillus drentensis TaxID=220684 RepID=UPI001F3D94AB|nr:ribulose-phosphate 3-epimerase [Neobacillus drentensis]ULT57031.1 ribulose-phosphate 3-epimerase [Neobacillus drentensis]
MAIVLASILDADWSKLADEIRDVDRAGVDGFSIDIMDGKFVPRTTFGPKDVSDIRNLTNVPIEVHLMVSNPENHVESYCDAGADQVVFHIEAANDPLSIIDSIHARGLRAGIAILKETPLDKLSDDVLKSIDALTIMAVTVGFGGQKPSSETVQRIIEIRERAKEINPNLFVVIDGGMKPDNCSEFVQAGADAVVIGTGIYHASNYEEAIKTTHQNIDPNEPVSKKRIEGLLAIPSKNRSEK